MKIPHHISVSGKLPPRKITPPPRSGSGFGLGLALELGLGGGQLSTTKLFINNETFLPSFIIFSDTAYSYLFYRTQDGSLLNLEIYKTKNYPLHYFLVKFWAFITVDRYHFGSGCDAVSSYIKKFFVNVRLTTMINLR